MGLMRKENNGTKLKALVGFNRVSCEEIGGTFTRIAGKDVCIIEETKVNDALKQIGKPNIEVIDVGEVKKLEYE